MPRDWSVRLLLAAVCATSGIHAPVVVLAQARQDASPAGNVIILDGQRKREAALAFAERSVAEAEGQYGPQHPKVGWSVVMVARHERKLGRYERAERELARALEIFRASSERAGEAAALLEISSVKERYGDFKGSYEASVAALDLCRVLASADDELLASAVNSVGTSLYNLTRFQEAASYFREALAIRQKILPPNHPDIVSSRFNIALIDDAQGRLGDARKSVEELIPLQERSAAEDPEALAKSLSFLATIVTKQNRFAEAETLHLQALRLFERYFGATYSGLAQPLINLGVHYTRQERGADAERVLLRALESLEVEGRKNDYLIAVALTALSANYINQWRYDEALPILQRALALQLRQFGENHQAVVVARTNLGRIHQQQGRLPEAADQLQRALEAAERLGLSNNERTIPLKIFYANVLMLQKRLPDAERSLREALASSQVVFGPDHVRTAEVLGGLGNVLQRQGRLSDAESSYASAARIWCDNMPVSVGCADALDSVATLQSYFKRSADALALYRRATEIAERRRQDRLLTNEAVLRAEHRMARDWYLNYLVLLNGDVLPPDHRAAQAFRAVQALRSSQTAQQVAKMAARQATGAGKLGQLTRQRQDLERDLERVDRDIAGALVPSDRSTSTLAELRRQRTVVEVKLAAVDDQIAQSFPAYKSLIDPEPLSVATAQRLLHRDEALVSFVVGPNATFINLVTPTATAFRLVWIKKDELGRRVTALRAHLDPLAAEAPGAVPFPYADAYALYKLLLAPLDAQLQDVRHLLIVLDGPLQSLPPSVLVTDDASIGQPVPWLIRRYAVSVLPAESALHALRTSTSGTDARPTIANAQPFIGFGDPLLYGSPGPLRSALRSGGGDGGRKLTVSEALRQLPRLPETRAELRSISKALGASERALFFGEQANEAQIKTTPLDSYRVIAFATHGLVADELPGVQEPALVLTPPDTPSVDNDGLLTASEVVNLSLRADWVVLSACNTAAGDGSVGAEGLSGLSKAFFYAGARTLLVSHWSVDSAASVALTTGTFAAYASGQTKAQALRTAALQMMESRKGGRSYSHPMYWAPFVVVGDGATTRVGGGRDSRSIRVGRGT